MNLLENIVLACALSGLVGCGTEAGTTKATEHSNTTNAPASIAYIGLFGDNALAVVDMTAGKVRTTIPVTAPDGIAITPDGAKVYVSSNDSGAVAVIDTASDSVKTTIAVGTQPQGMVATEDGKYVIVAVQGDGDAAIIDTAMDAVVARAPIGKAHSAATNADGTLSFVSSQAPDAPAVQLVDVPSGAPAGTFPVEAAPRALADVDGKLYVTLVGSADVDVLDATSGQKLGAITTDGSPHDVRPTRDGSRVLTVSQTAGELVFIDPATSTLVAHVATGTMPHWIGLPSDGREAYVTNEGDNDVVVVDLATHAVTKTFAVGQAPRKIVVRP
jgi:YVTN family beta-propeller protein